MSGKFRIGTLRDLYTQPLYRTLQGSASAELLFNTPAVHIDRLMSKESDAAFVHPMDYGINSSDLIIYPGIGVSASGFAGTVRLYLRGELRDIKTMAVGTVTTTDVVLARVVLGEKYDSVPAIVPVAGTVEAMLAKADCALVAGEVLHSVQTKYPFIDLVDEWSDITELPFVHSICVGRSESFNKDLSDLLIVSQESGKNELRTLADELSRDRSQSPDVIYNFLTPFTYGFDDQSRESLETFFQMAFFHGLMGDVPEIVVAG
ncbi:MAG: MqnA/MqnD/SBP family protein [Bacteroidota bacterium]